MAGKRRARFALAIEPYLDSLFRAAWRLTQDRADAQELVQDTCVRAFERRDSWRDAHSPLAWLMRVQYNLFIDRTRRDRSSTVVSIGDVDESGVLAGRCFDPEINAGTTEQMARVLAAWDKLKQEHRALLALRVEGYTLSEMVEITGIPAAALNMRLHRARQNLVQHLGLDQSANSVPSVREIQR